jgi:dTDP-4-amino-4,6-dideoxygalactose transaminase
VVVEVDGDGPLSRDALVAMLQAEGCMARRYFYPGVHRMEPYASLSPMAHHWLPRTERLASRVMVLPSGTAMTPAAVGQVVELIGRAYDERDAVSKAASPAALRSQPVGWSE